MDGKFYTPEQITSEMVDGITVTLDNLAMEAERSGNEAWKILFKALSSDFYILTTHGTVDDRNVFELRASEAITKLENFCLTIGGLVPEHQANAVKLYKDSRPDME